MKLRFASYPGTTGFNPRTVLLQQWWEGADGGEWRDVPIVEMAKWES